jgi:FlaA1/EpsC-like NDP-sugar epimerase
MIRLAGYEPEEEIAVEFTGPRPGEKLAEELLNADEREEATSADRIVRAVRAEPLDPLWVETTIERLERLVVGGDEAGLADRVVELIIEREPIGSELEVDVDV